MNCLDPFPLGKLLFLDVRMELFRALIFVCIKVENIIQPRLFTHTTQNDSELRFKSYLIILGTDFFSSLGIPCNNLIVHL